MSGDPTQHPSLPEGKKLVYRIKPYVPVPLWELITAPYWWWYNRARHQLAALFDRRLIRSQQELLQYKDLHKGQRCFIIGNGPSLNKTNLKLLENEVTFGMNRIYLLFPKLGFETNYFVSINTLVLEQCREDILGLDMPRFITWRARRWFDDRNIYFLDTDYTDPPSFAKDIRGRVFEGSTVTFVALQMAFFMGFEEVILVGVDHSFSTQGKPNETVISEGADPDHFSSNYFGQGFRWQLPDLVASEMSYQMAKSAYELDGRRVLDATVEGKLQIFPKVDYLSLF